MNKRERILLGVFTFALATGGGVLGWSTISRQWQARENALKTKLKQITEAKKWVAEKDTWLAKERWIAGTVPTLYQGQQTDAAFFEAIQRSLNQYQIEIVEQRILETQKAGGGVLVGIDLVLSSTLENLIRWLHIVQRPEAFRILSRIRLKSDPATSHIRTELSLKQYFDASQTAHTP